MDNLIQDSVNYNSAYISLNLLDELDYCIGGYGKPTPEFIFSLNTFVESFMACSEFYTSLDELNHLNLTAGAIFPNGRPILNLVVRETGLKFVSGVLDLPGKVIYREETIGKTRKEAEQDFIAEYGQTLRNDYFSMSNVDNLPDKLPLVTSKFGDSEFIVSEVQSNTYDLIANLISVSNTSSIQTTLPINLYGQQVNRLRPVPYSIDALEKLAALHKIQVDDLVKSIGLQYMPIPPFTNILLSQVNDLYDIPSKLTQLRADFQELRDRFVKFEEQIYASPTIKEQLEAYKEFTSFWDAFAKKYANQAHRLFYQHLDVFQNVDADKSANSIIKTGDTKDIFKELNIAKIAGKVITHSWEWFQDRKVINRFKGLTNIWELFQNSDNISQQLGHFERLFGVKFTTAELNRVHDFVNNQVQNLPKTLS
ncbi:hypothetical protein ACFS5N_05835 [Mucilaginibacter ximonensis]|uniref:Uncharacterized protein n=1 Tax=Mucilaginibacter ximonensis TaxID=538021 RepID=A0ABW5Y9D5_9SPHI